MDQPSSPLTGAPSASPRRPSNAAEILANLFAIDLRSLALFRVTIGTIILIDLFSRARYLTAHYTDRGVLPRADLYFSLLQPWQWSVHLLSGSAAWQVFLFVIAGICALAMIFGYRTRWAVFFTWVLAASVQYRNPMVNNSGDMLLRVLLFWSLWLPLGARYSIDAAVNSREAPPPTSVSNMATAALLLQTCMVYWFTAALKDHLIWRVDHSAVYYALSIEQFIRPLGKWLYGFPDLLPVLTIFTLYLEIIGPALAFLPFWTGPLRVLVILAFFGLHLAFGVTMSLGCFPWISAASWLPFVPTWFWEKLFARLRTPRRLGLRIYYDGDCGFCKRMARLVRTFFLLPETPLIPAQSDPSIHADMKSQNSWVIVDADGNRTFKFQAFLTLCRHSPVAFWIVPLLALPPCAWFGRRVYETIASNRDKTGPIVHFLDPRPLNVELPRPANALLGFLLGYVILWNVRTMDYEKYVGFLPAWTDPIGYSTTLAQRWDMFAPYPLTDDGWFVIPARLHNGREVDVFRGGRDLSWDKPAWVVYDYPSDRWRKFHMNLSREPYKGARKPYAEYLCWDWNRRHPYDEKLDGLDIYYMLELTLPDYATQPVRARLLHAHHNVPGSGPLPPMPVETPGPIRYFPSLTPQDRSSA